MRILGPPCRPMQIHVHNEASSGGLGSRVAQSNIVSGPKQTCVRIVDDNHVNSCSECCCSPPTIVQSNRVLMRMRGWCSAEDTPASQITRIIVSQAAIIIDSCMITRLSHCMSAPTRHYTLLKYPTEKKQRANMASKLCSHLNNVPNCLEPVDQT